MKQALAQSKKMHTRENCRNDIVFEFLLFFEEKVGNFPFSNLLGVMELSFEDAIKARKEKFEKERAERLLSGKKTPRPEWVLKRYSDVSYEEYMHRVEQHVPFIVTDVCLLEGKENVWDFLSSTVGAKTVNVERRNEPCTLVTVKEVIERVHINNEEDLYMYDIPLAKKMPVLLESVR